MPHLETALPGQNPATIRPVLPLQGVTILLVEDSRYVSEALRLLAQRSGARLRRVALLAEAQRHLALYRPDLVIADIGLPDGSGLDLIADLAQGGQVPVVAISGDPELEAAALRAGAVRFVEKPLPGLAAFVQLVADLVPGLSPQVSGSGCAAVATGDTLALREDLHQAARLLSATPDARTRRYLARFLRGIARSADDPVLAQEAGRLPGADAEGVARLAGLLSLRIGQQPTAFS